MSLIIALGSNLGDRKYYLSQALQKLCKKFSLIAQSRIYESESIGPISQGQFLNQVLEFQFPNSSPEEVLGATLLIEQELGRTRKQKQGPRTIDIDIIHFGHYHFFNTLLSLPHPEWKKRSFVVKPFLELPFSQQLQRTELMALQFSTDAHPIAE